MVLVFLAIYTLNVVLLTSLSGAVYLVEWELLAFSPAPITLPFFFDPISFYFLMAVSVITVAVALFSWSYMSLEKFFMRFHTLVFLFVLSMFMLVASPNMVSMLLGWDGLGVTSFLLVVYFNSKKSFNAGFITALSNRVGDCCILIAIGVTMVWLPFNLMLWSDIGNKTLWGGGALLMAAAMTKSAQIPFSAWLPAAMAAPTPVSSLVHSSTLVTAGVYVLIRLNDSLPLKSGLVLFFLGGGTSLLAGLAALSEMDMKKVVALSTLSQLGFMVMMVSGGTPLLSFFHLLTHAFFKALLFISVGNLIHLNSAYQDIRKISNGGGSLKTTLAFSMCANFSLMGFPYMGGFYSKDALVESFQADGFLQGSMIVYAGVMLTIMYTVRFFKLILWKSVSTPSLCWSKDMDLSGQKGMSLLWSLATVGGALVSWALFQEPAVFVIPEFVKFATLSVILISVLMSMSLFTSDLSLSSSRWFSTGMWALPSLTLSLTSTALRFAARMFFNLDSSWSMSYFKTLPSQQVEWENKLSFMLNSHSFLILSTFLGVFFLIY